MAERRRRRDWRRSGSARRPPRFWPSSASTPRRSRRLRAKAWCVWMPTWTRVEAMPDFYVKVGDSVSFAKTVSETDIYLFAGITGDFSVNHVNEQYMARSKFGRRIAHGALIVGYMSTCSTMMIDKCQGATLDTTPVSLGYDRVRFLA